MSVIGGDLSRRPIYPFPEDTRGMCVCVCLCVCMRACMCVYARFFSLCVALTVVVFSESF